jgi:hypothetical protein
MATKSHLVIDQGSTYSVTLNVTDINGDPMNLNGYTPHAKIKKWYTSNSSIDFNASINVDNGSVTLALDSNTTANIAPGRYVYDVVVTDNLSTSRIVEGLVVVTPAVTK